MSPKNLFEMQAIIKVIGVGGAGGNAVNRMVEHGLEGVHTVAVNTDVQALGHSLADVRLPIGAVLTKGMGSGGDPGKGEASLKESERAVAEILEGSDLVFITAGMGGGTGTGAAPLIAQLARRMGIMTIGIVTKPFPFEGARRKAQAEAGIEALRAHVDTLLVIPNSKLMETLDRKVRMEDAFRAADDVLRQGVQGIADVILEAGHINVDFNDVRAVIRDGGLAVMGIGRASGEHRARLAAEQAVSSPLLETGLRGARRLLVNITSGLDFGLDEAHEAMEYLHQFLDAEDAEVFMGHVINEDLAGQLQITVVATGMDGAGPLPLEQAVFGEAAVRERPTRREPAVQPEAAAQASVEPMDTADLDIDIPSFLRRQKQV